MTYEKLKSLGIDIDRGKLGKDLAFEEDGLREVGGVRQSKAPALLNVYTWNGLKPKNVKEPKRKRSNNWERKLG